MVSTEKPKDFKPDFFRSLQTLSNPDRFDIFKILSKNDGKIRYNQILKKKYAGSKDRSSTLSNHLNKLKEIGIVNRDTYGYFLTSLGKELSSKIQNIHDIFHNYNKRLFVRTSDFCFEPFEERKIVDYLIKEAGMDKNDALKIAPIATKRLTNANVDYLTAPLIREFINTILIELGFEDYRHKLTRLGLPPYDINALIEKAEFDSIDCLFKELGKNVFEEYLLTNLLPQGNADFYLSGKLFFLHPENWALLPLELALPGNKFTDMITKKLANHETAEDKLKYFPSIVKELLDNFKEFFSGGLLISNFTDVLNLLTEYLGVSIKDIIKIMFSSFPRDNIKTSCDSRSFHDENWEIWLEIPINDLLHSDEVIQGILQFYSNDYNEIHQYSQLENPSQKKFKHLQNLLNKPNLLFNISKDVSDTIPSLNKYEDAPTILKQTLNLSVYHNALFICQKDSKKTSNEFTYTPSLTPIVYKSELGFTRVNLVIDKVFINLPRILQKSENISLTDSDIYDDRDYNYEENQILKDKLKFFSELKQWVFNAINLFDLKFKLISKYLKKFKNWDILSNLFANEDLLNQNKDLLEYSGKTKIICNICLNGLVETIEYFTGFYPDQSNNSFSFLQEIISFVADLLKNNSNSPNVDYVLGQTHLDNYLQTRFNQDANLLERISVEFYDESQKQILSLYNGYKNFKENNVTTSKNYSITTFMKDRSNQSILPNLSPYSWSIFRFDNQKDFVKRIDDFCQYQSKMGYGACIDFYLNEPLKMEDSTDLFDKFKIIVEKGIKVFGFSRILGKNIERAFYKQLGCYKPLNYYKSLLKNAIFNRRDSLC